MQLESPHVYIQDTDNVSIIMRGIPQVTIRLLPTQNDEWWEINQQ